MVEAVRRVPAWAVLALGLVLAWVPLLWTAWPAWFGVWLAQPLLIAGWGRMRGGRALPWREDLPALLLLWGLSAALLALVAALPLEALRESGALLPALGLSVSVGLVLLGLWRWWPSYALAIRSGARFSGLIAVSGSAGPADAWRGLAIAAAVFGVLALALTLAWPGLLPAPLRWWGVLAQPVLALSAYALIHRYGAPPDARTLPQTAVSAEISESATSVDPLLDRSPNERLFAALHEGRIDAALTALADGADPHALPGSGERDQRSLPMLAALQSDLRVLRELIGRGVDLNLAHGGLTPLLAATRDSWHGRPEAVMMLLANGADSRSSDADGNTALHHAARSTDPAVAALLLDAGAVVDALNGEGYTALGVACAANNWRLARYLIEHGAKADPANGQPALLAAVSGDDDPAGVQLLLRHKARVDARGLEQRTALMQACATGNVDVVGALLEAGADRNAHDAHGITPLLDAARHAHDEVVARLALTRPDVAACDEQQRNALILACRAGASPELLRQLLAMGVDAEHRDSEGRRALDYALESGRWPQVSVLDPDYTLPANVAESLAEGHFEKTPRELLREALIARRPESAEAMLRLGVGPGPEALTALLLEFADADSENDLTAFDWLSRHGASADLRLDGGDSVLFVLFDRGGRALPVLQRVLEQGQAVGGSGGLARFLFACASGDNISRSHEQMALALLERGADAFGASTPAGDPPLVLAIRLGWQRLAEALLVIGADPNGRDSRGHTPIHVASGLGRESALRLLLRYGALPQMRSPDGLTPLGMALASGRSDLSYWLEWRGWSLPGRRLLPGDLPAAAISGDAEAVVRLLDLGLPVDAVDPQGCTALLRAAGGGHEGIVGYLLERGADPGLSARTGATPLSAAISMRHARIVDLLLQAGADPDQSLPGDVTPLMLAAALGLPEIAGRLLQKNATVGARDAQGLSALHCAALHGFTARDRSRLLALFDLLLLADLEPDLANAAGQTPLLLLLGARAEAGAACDEDVLLAALERLINEGVSLDNQDQRGLSALHLAAMHGLPRVVQRLLREGAERSSRDALGRTPHDLALLRGYVDIAAEFEPTRAAPSLARFLREPR